MNNIVISHNENLVTSTGPEYKLIQGLSNFDISNISENTNISEVISELNRARKKVNDDADALEAAKKEKEDNGAISNWWNNRNDKIKEASSSLQSSMLLLTEQSAKLLGIITAISKVLCGQQNILNEQQYQIMKTNEELKQQGERIQDQQNEIKNQQDKINNQNSEIQEQANKIKKQNDNIQEKSDSLQ